MSYSYYRMLSVSAMSIQEKVEVLMSYQNQEFETTFEAFDL